MPAVPAVVNVVNVVNMHSAAKLAAHIHTQAAAVVHTLADRGVRLVAEDRRLLAFGTLTDADRDLIRAYKPALLALLEGSTGPSPAPALVLIQPAAPVPAAAAEPDQHCPACGSPSWWRSPSSPAWRCAYCEPRERRNVEAVESLTLDSGRWRAGCAPPAPERTVTVADLLVRHGPTVAGCRLVDVLEQADDDDLPDFLDRDVLEGFARALVADRRVRPLPPTDLPPLARLAAELGDEPGELRAWLDRTGPGRAVCERLEREAGACDRALLALRADPDGGLLPLLARAIDGEPQTPRATT